MAPSKRRKKDRETTAEEVETRARPRKRDAKPLDGKAPSDVSSKPAGDAVPDDVREKFTKVGRRYLFPDGAHAFTDKGARLTTRSENREVIRSMTSIAQARGWQEVSVRGTEEFRREAWLNASMLGLRVRGYRPNEADKVRLVRTATKVAVPPAERERESAEQPSDPRPPEKSAAPAQPRDRQLILGTLVEHGRAPYQNKAGQADSYYVKLKTAEGERVIWGIDLERAFRRSISQPKPGDEVALRAVRREPVTVKSTEKNSRGERVERELSAHRNRWQVETKEFSDRRDRGLETFRKAQADPSTAVRQNPELIDAYVHMRGAEIIAKDKIKNPERRKNFLRLVRNEMADMLGRDQRLKPAQLRDPPKLTPVRTDRDEPPTR